MNEESYLQHVSNLLAVPLDDYMKRACRVYFGRGVPPSIAARNLRMYLFIGAPS